MLSAQISTDGPAVVPPVANVVVTDATNGGVTVRPGEPAPVVPAAVERPAGLPEKFKTMDDLVKSYAELEKKIGAPAAVVPPVVPAAVQKLDLGKLSAEFAANEGKLSAETLKALETAGVSQADVQSFVAGQKAVAAQQRSDLATAVNGEENLTTLLKWAETGLTAGEIAAYNAMLATDNRDGAKALLTTFAAKYTAEYGSTGERVVAASSASSAGVTPFNSSAEVTAAMSDKRYQNDPAYRAGVAARLNISSIFG